MSKLDFNTEAEKKLVDQVFSNAIDSLSEEDQKLPQVLFYCLNTLLPFVYYSYSNFIVL